MKTVEEAAILTSMVAGVGWVAKKALKETFTGDPSSSVMNYVKMTAAVAGSIALKDYCRRKSTFLISLKLDYSTGEAKS